MNRLCAALLGDGDDLAAEQIAFFRSRRAEAIGFVAFSDVLGVGVSIRVHGDRADTHAARGGSDAAGDFAAVGDEDFFKHGVGSPLA